jgi:hypothetical protein
MKLFLVGIIFFTSSMSYAQCEHSVAFKSEINKEVELGSISADITSNERFICSLVIESASGTEIVDETKGSGNQTVLFSGLKIGILYSVKIKFPDNEEFVCSNLRKSIFLK